MSSNGEISGMHYRAAVNHEAVAVLHRKTAELHADNKTDDARACAKAAMDSSNKAQNTTIEACGASGR